MYIDECRIEHLREFIDLLHKRNINEYIDLPEIAVMGDTSSGWQYVDNWLILCNYDLEA